MIMEGFGIDQSFHRDDEEAELAENEREHEKENEGADGDEDKEDEDDEEESEAEFDCEPVRKRSRLHYSDIKPALEKPRISNGLRDLGISFNDSRNRRPGALLATIQGYSTGYVDQDTSGTYDPTRRRATRSPTPISRPIKERAQNDENGQPRTKQKKRVGFALPVILTLTSEKGHDYLKSIPDGPYSSASEAEDEVSDIEHDSEYSSSADRHRRSRRVKTSAKHLEDVTLDQIPENLRRGCKGCYELGDTECCVATNKYSWPCDACADARIDCEMIIPFEFKTGCLRCRRKRLRCSFRDDAGKGVNQCSYCEAADETCIAGPLPKALELKSDVVAIRSSNITKTKSKTLMSVPKNFSLQSSTPALQSDPTKPQRLYISCTQCRETGGRCRLKRHQDGPCANCKRAGETCKFVYAPTRISLLSGSNTHVKRSSGNDRAENSRAHNYEDNTRQIYTEILNKKQYNTTRGKAKLPSKKYRSNSRIVPLVPERRRARLIGTTSGIQHIIITTSFCHPIRFHYAPDPKNRYPCSWCASPVFGLWGHSPKEVEVVPYGKNGNEEIAGGHSEDGVEQTKMCCNCTLERMTIMYCEGHSMKPIDGLDPKTLDLGAIGQSLVALAQEDHVSAELVKRVKWCSVCVSPAEYSCDSQGEGCGMHLCQTCNDLLVRLQKSWSDSAGLNFMDELVKLWKADLWKRGDMGELRADTEFLLTTGELSVRMNLGMEMSSFEDGNVGLPKGGNPSQSFESSHDSQGSMFSANGGGKESQDTSYSGSSQNNSVQHTNNSLTVRSLPQTPGRHKMPGNFGSPSTPGKSLSVSSSRPNSSPGLSLTPKYGFHIPSDINISAFDAVYPNPEPAKDISSIVVSKIPARGHTPVSVLATGPRKFTIPSPPQRAVNPALLDLHAQARANASASSSTIRKSTQASQNLTFQTQTSHLPQTPSASQSQFFNAMNASVNAKKRNNQNPGTTAMRRSVSTTSLPAASSSNTFTNRRPALKAPFQSSPSINLISSDDENNEDSPSEIPKPPTQASRNIRNHANKHKPASTGFRFIDEVDVDMEMNSLPSSSASSPTRRSKKSQKPAATNLRFIDEVDVDMGMNSLPNSSTSSPTRRSKKPQRPAPTNFRFLDEVDVEMEMRMRPGSEKAPPPPLANNLRFLDEVDVKREVEGWRERRDRRRSARGNGVGEWNGIVPVGADIIELGGESEDESGGGVEEEEDA